MCTSYLGLLLTDVYRFGPPPPPKKKSGTLPLATNSPSSCFITMIMCKKFPMIKHKRCWDQISTLKCVQSPTNSCSLYLLCNMQISYHLIFQTKFPTNIGEQELFFLSDPDQVHLGSDLWVRMLLWLMKISTQYQVVEAHGNKAIWQCKWPIFLVHKLI